MKNKGSETCESRIFDKDTELLSIIVDSTKLIKRLFHYESSAVTNVMNVDLKHPKSRLAVSTAKNEHSSVVLLTRI